MKSLFDTDNSINIEEYIFSHLGEELNERTRKRLQQLIDMGCVETGNASFGYEGVFSGLYIERVWRYDDECWNDYIKWAQGLINSKK